MCRCAPVACLCVLCTPFVCRHVFTKLCVRVRARACVCACRHPPGTVSGCVCARVCKHLSVRVGPAERVLADAGVRILTPLSPACVDVLGSLRACWAACVPVCTGSSRIRTHVHACVLNRHRAPCTSGAFVQCLSVVMTVLSVSQASSVLGLPGAIRSGWPGLSQGPPRPQTGCPIPAALSQEPPPPAGHPPACHLCWLNLGARVRQPSQVPGHMGGCI